ncbi:MAG: DUF1080 domain-containing protein [Verrucomicrobiota bacterium]
MKKTLSVLMLGVVGSCFLLAGGARGEDGWVTIFDGTSLDGWKASTDNPAAFSVEEDGTLKLTGERAHLYYVGPDGDADFSDFELKMKVKTLPNANSGVYFHTKYQENGWPDHGYEAQVNATHKDPKKTGSLYAVMNMYVDMEGGEKPEEPYLMMDKRGMNMVLPEAPNTDGEWFDYSIKVEGKTVTIAVNGKTTVEFTEPEGWGGPNANMGGRKLSSGTIALQAHDPGSTVYYKDIELKIND